MVHVIETWEHDIKDLLEAEEDSDREDEEDKVWEQAKHLYSHKKGKNKRRTYQNSKGKSNLGINSFNKLGKKKK